MPRAAGTSEGVKKCRRSGLHWDRVFRCSTEEGLLKWLEANQSQDGCHWVKFRNHKTVGIGPIKW